MTLKNIVLLFIIGSAILINNACNNECKKENKTNGDKNQINQIVKNKDIFRVPLPVDLYLFMTENKIPYKTKLMNNVENIEKYYSNADRAINLGIYSSDLAYATAYKDNQNINKYFIVCKKISDLLALNEGFDKETILRIDKNINNPDSLFEIANDAYWNVFLSLEEQGKVDILSAVIYGAWIESVYISVNAVSNFNINNEITQRIIDQNLILENIQNYISQTNSNEDSTKNSIQKELSEIQTIYDKIVSDIDSQTKPNFEVLKKKINEIRNKWVK